MIVHDLQEGGDIFALAERVRFFEDRAAHDHEVVIVAQLALEALGRGFVAIEYFRPSFADKIQMIAQVLGAFSPFMEAFRARFGISGLAYLLIPPDGSAEAFREREQIGFLDFPFIDTSRECA
jgi:hypothetical protein